MRELILGLVMFLFVVMALILLMMLGGAIAEEACANGKTFQLHNKTYACFEQVPDKN